MKRVMFLLFGGAILSGVAAYAAMARTERSTVSAKDAAPVPGAATKD